MARTKTSRKAKKTNAFTHYNPANNVSINKHERKIAINNQRKARFERIYHQRDIQEGDVVMMLAISVDSVRESGIQIGAYGAVSFTCNAKAVQGGFEGPLAGGDNFDLLGTLHILRECAEGTSITIITKHQRLFNFLNGIPAPDVKLKYTGIIHPIQKDIKEVIRNKGLHVNSKMLDSTLVGQHQVYLMASRLAIDEKQMRMRKYAERSLANNQHDPVKRKKAIKKERKKAKKMERLVNKELEYKLKLEQQRLQNYSMVTTQAVASSSFSSMPPPFYYQAPLMPTPPSVLKINQVKYDLPQHQQPIVESSYPSPSARTIVSRDSRVVQPPQTLQPQLPLSLSSAASSSSTMPQASNSNIGADHSSPSDVAIVYRLKNRIENRCRQREQYGTEYAVGSSTMTPQVFTTVADNPIRNAGKDDLFGSSSSSSSNSCSGSGDSISHYEMRGGDGYVDTGNSNVDQEGEEMFVDAVDHFSSSDRQSIQGPDQEQGIFGSMKQWVTGAFRRFDNY